MKFLTATLLFVLINSCAFATNDKKLIRIRLTGPGGFVDETSVYFDLGINPAFTTNEDAPKGYSNIPNAPSIYSLTTDNVVCSTNGYGDLSSSAIIALGVKTDTSGQYNFTANLLNNFDPSTIIELEDRQQHVFVDLRNNFYPVILADSQIITGRFFLHLSRAVTFSSVTAGCDNNDGVLMLNQDSAILWSSYNLFGSTGYLLQSTANSSGNHNFSNLPEGNYKIVMVYGVNVVTKSVYVNGNYAVAHIHPSTMQALVNQVITFYTAAHNVSYYEWHLGDVTDAVISGVANPDYAFLQPGVYNVALTGSNDAGCQYRDSVSVTISAATGINDIADGSKSITANAATVTVVLNEEIAQGAEMKIFNLLGQPAYNSPLTEHTSVIELGNQPTGYYVVSVVNNHNVFTKRVFIGK